MANPTATENMTEFTVDRETLEVRMSRVFEAPRDTVYRVYTEPDLFAKWWGPREFQTEVEELDVTPGGKWRAINIDPQGGRHVFYGEYREVVAPELIVWTFEYEPTAGHVVLDTARLEDLGGRTRLTTTSKFASLEDLEGMVQHGMEWGARQSMDKLAELLPTL